MVWLYLVVAILAEVMATTALKLSEGFKRPAPSLLVVLGYAGAFYFLSKVLNDIPISVAYAIWSGAGIALVGVVGWVWLDQKLDLAALLGMGLIVWGVLVINLFSKTAAH